VIAQSRRSAIRNPKSGIDWQIMAVMCAEATHGISAAERPKNGRGLRHGVQIFADPHPARRFPRVSVTPLPGMGRAAVATKRRFRLTAPRRKPMR
jgi:hypothetical protein